MVPQTRYAKCGSYSIAYQVAGDGPFDLLWVPGFVSNVELAWEEPLLARFLERLASFSRLILFDKRGTGLSDRLPIDQLPTLEQRLEDVIAVLDAAGSERAALFGHSEGGNLAVLFAASQPQRTIALVTAGIFAKRVWSPDYPWAPTPEERARDIETLERNWGVDADVEHLAPSAARDGTFGRRLATYFRRSASPGAAAALMRMNTQIDIRAVLPVLRVPTLMIQRTGDRDATLAEGRWISEQVPGAGFVELSGDDHLPWVGDQDSLLDTVEEFLTGTPRAALADRILTTALFTDIVGSTERASALGDRAWSALVEDHNALIRAELVSFADARSTRPATDSWPPSMGPRGRSVVRAQSLTPRVRWGSRCAPACTPANASWSATGYEAPQCTREPASPLLPAPVRYSSHPPWSV